MIKNSGSRFSELESGPRLLEKMLSIISGLELVIILVRCTKCDKTIRKEN